MTLTQVTTGGVDENINIDSNTLKVDGTNNRVGIGTASPENSLHIADTSGPIIRLTNSTGTDGTYTGRISTGDAAGTFFAGINFFKHDTNDGEIRFRTKVDGTNQDTVTIVDGRVGIGTTSPARGGLHIHKASTAELHLTDDTTGSTSSDGFTLFSHGASAGVWYRESAPLRFATASTERMRIDSSGRLLLGTTTEGYSSGDDLTIATSGHTGITLRSGTTSEGAVYFSDATSGGGEYIGSLVYSHNTNSMNFTANGAERMRVTSDGRLLIGKSSGAYPLEVGGVSNPNIRCDGTSTSGQRGLIFSYNGTNFGSVGQNIQTGELTIRSGESGQTGYYITLETGATERMRIGSDGVVQVNQSTGNAFRVQNSTSGEANMLFQNSSTGTSVGNGLYVGISSNESSYMWAYHNEPMIWGTNNAERMRITSGGTVLIGKTSANATGAGAEIRTAASGQLILGKTYSGTVNGIFFNHNTSYVGGLNYTNTGTSLQTSSDYRLKENIVAVTNAIERAKQLNPVRFNFIIEPDETVEGFIAHELGQVVPEACCGEKDAVNEDGSVKPQTIAQEKIIPLLTAALQEAIAKIETLETKVAALEAAA